MKLEGYQRLVEKAMVGDRQAYSDLCEVIIQDVLYICVKITGNLHDAEDAAQEALVQLAFSIRKLKDAKAFPLWLNRCITNSCRDYMKKERRRVVHIADGRLDDLMEINTEFLPECWSEQESTRQIVLDALQKLPMRQQHILLMYYFQDMSTKEIAKVNKITESAVRSNLQYARNNLRKHVEKTTGAPLTAMPAFAAVPTITLILRLDAARLVGEESARRVLLAVSTALAGGAATAAGVQTAVLVAGMAPAAAALVVAAAVSFGSSPSPSLTAEVGIGITPQYSDSAPAAEEGEGGLYIEPSESGGEPPRLAYSEGADVQENPRAPQSGDTPAGGFVAVGSLVLVDSGGEELRHTELDYTGVYVRASAPGVADTFALAEIDGTYALHLPSSSLVYTIRVEQLPLPAFGDQVAEVQLPPGQSVAPPLRLQDSMAPECILLLFTQDGGAGAVVNPANASLQVSDATPCTAGWQILPRGEERPAANGEGSEVDIAALGLAKGRYTLVYSVCDLAGNTSLAEANFVIR